MTEPRIEYVGRISPTRGWTMPAHRHDTHAELIIVLGGRLQARLAGQTLDAGPGQILYYPRGEMHEECSVGSSPLETLYIGFHVPGARPELLSNDSSGHVAGAARWMLSLMSTRQAADAQVATGLLRAIVHQLTQPRGASDELVARVQRYVAHHLGEPLSLERLADAMGMSRFYFARRFTRATGMGPMAYVRQTRVEAARALLQNQSLPLSAIASMVGLGDQTHLSRTFRRVTGMTPGQARR